MSTRSLSCALLMLSLTGCSPKTTPLDTDTPKVAQDAGRRVDAGSHADAAAKDEPAPVDMTDDDDDGDDGAPGMVDAGPSVKPDAPDAGAVQTDAGAAADAATAPGPGGAFTLSSTVYQDGKAIPATSRCESPSPPVSWSAGPSATKSYALTLIDVTPGFSRGYVHWQIYDIPADKLELPMGVPSGAAPTGLAPIKQGPNYSRTRVYTGPCGGDNMYELTLYAIDVDTLPMLTATSTSAQVLAAIEAHDLAKSTVHVTSSAN